MPETWPSDIIPTDSEFWLESHTAQHVSPFTRQTQVLVRQGRRWRCRASFTLPRAKARRLDALFARLDGPAGTVRVWDFDRPNPGGTARSADDAAGAPEPWSDGTFFSDGTGWITGGTPRISFGALAGATTIATDGWAAGETVLVEGDYVRLGDQLVMLVADAEADDSGAATLEFRPPLRADTPVHVDGVPTVFTWRRATAEFRLIADDQARNPSDVNHVYRYDIEMFEVLPTGSGA